MCERTELLRDNAEQIVGRYDADEIAAGGDHRRASHAPQRRDGRCHSAANCCGTGRGERAAPTGNGGANAASPTGNGQRAFDIGQPAVMFLDLKVDHIQAGLNGRFSHPAVEGQDVSRRTRERQCEV